MGLLLVSSLKVYQIVFSTQIHADTTYFNGRQTFQIVIGRPKFQAEVLNNAIFFLTNI